MSKILTMKYPPITSYHFDSDLLSVILNEKDSLHWFYTNYVQLRTTEIGKKGDCFRLHFSFPYSLWKSCPWIYYQRISNKIIQKKWDSIINFLIDCIDLNYYVYLEVDQFYIPGTLYYQKKNYSQHDIFIYGYDLQEEVFFFTEYLYNNSYSYSKVSFKDFEQAHNSLLKINDAAKEIEAEMISIKRREPIYNFDINILLRSLNDYLDGKDSFNIQIPTEQSYSFVYGVNIYENLKHYLNCYEKELIGFDTRIFHVLWEHKKVMLSRIKYMEQNGYLENADFIYNQYLEIEKKALENRNILIKYSLNKKNDLIKRMLNNLDKILMEEKKAIEFMIKNIIIKK